MKRTDRNALEAFLVVILIGLLVAIAGSQVGSLFLGIDIL